MEKPTAPSATRSSLWLKLVGALVALLIMFAACCTDDESVSRRTGNARWGTHRTGAPDEKSAAPCDVIGVDDGEEVSIPEAWQALSAHRMPQWGDAWIAAVESGKCSNATSRAGIKSCETDGRTTIFRFAAGQFELSQQVVLPPNVELVGNAAPSDWSTWRWDRGPRPPRANVLSVTYFVAPARTGCGPSGSTDTSQPAKCYRCAAAPPRPSAQLRNVCLADFSMAQREAGVLLASHVAEHRASPPLIPGDVADRLPMNPTTPGP
jgi:hypothetical protein